MFILLFCVVAVVIFNVISDQRLRPPPPLRLPPPRLRLDELLDLDWLERLDEPRWLFLDAEPPLFRWPLKEPCLLELSLEPDARDLSIELGLEPDDARDLSIELGLCPELGFLSLDRGRVPDGPLSLLLFCALSLLL